MKKSLLTSVFLIIGCLFASCHKELDSSVVISDSPTQEPGLLSPVTKATLPDEQNSERRYNHLVTLTNFTIFESGQFSLLLTKEMAKDLNISEEEYLSYLDQLQKM